MPSDSSPQDFPAAQNAAVNNGMRSTPGTVRAAAQALAQRTDTTFVYTTTGTGDCVAEILTKPARMGDVLSDELPSTIGLRDSTSYPVLRYFRTIRGWRLEILSTDRVEALRSGLSPYLRNATPARRLT